MKSYRRQDILEPSINECDGGGDAGGAVGGDAGGAVGGDVAIDFDGTSVEDVLGKNEPGKGYMGPGNFYIPSKVKVPFHRYEIANGGSKRKKNKKGKPKKYSYEQGMKVVVDMFESEFNESKINFDKIEIRTRLSKLASSIKNMNDVKRISQSMNINGSKKQKEFEQSKFSQLKETFIDFGNFLSDIVKGKYKASWFTITMIATALLYIISPIDIIPDLIPVVGIIDDAFVLQLVYNAVKDEFLKWKSIRNNL